MTRAKNGMTGGILCVLLSAVIFGVTPVPEVRLAPFL